MATAQDMLAQDQAFSQQYDAQQAQKTQQEQQAKQPPPPPWMAQVGRVSVSQIDAAVNDTPPTVGERAVHDVAAGAITGATNIADSLVSMAKSNADDVGMGPINTALIHRLSPIWDDAKNAIMDFRDAVQVQDPTLADNLTQGVAQLAIPFAGYSRMLAGMHGFARVMAAGAVTDATALQPHDMRLADLYRIGQQSEGKLADTLNTIAPDGSLLNGYINYMTDRTNESEAAGRWKNVLDGAVGNLILTPILHTAGVVLKQGQYGLRYAMENGVRNTLSDLAPSGPMMGSPAAQRGMIGYHGSPHDFAPTSDNPLGELDLGKVGTGEGQQVRGYGSYVAQDSNTGTQYRNAFITRTLPKDSPMYTAAAVLKTAKGNQSEAYMRLADAVANEKDPIKADRYRRAAELVKAGNVKVPGAVYHVDVPDETVAKMIDQDGLIKAQPHILSKIPQGDLEAIQNYSPHPIGSMTGKDFVSALETTMEHGGINMPRSGKSPAAAASAYLDAHGIPGSKYLDQGSRGTGEGTRNLVLFNPKRDSKIVHKEK